MAEQFDINEFFASGEEAQNTASPEQFDVNAFFASGEGNESTVPETQDSFNINTFFGDNVPLGTSQINSSYRNSTSNKWEIATDQMMGSIYSTLGMFSDAFDAPETAADFRKTSTDYEEAAARRPTPDVSMSIIDEGEKIIDQFGEGEILGAITDTAEYVHSVLIGAAPSLLGTGAAVGAGAVLAPILATAGIPALLTASVVGLTPGLLLSAGDIHDEAVKYGADSDEAIAVGLGAGTVYGLLDRLGMAFLLGGLSKKLGKDLTIKTIEKQTGLPNKTVAAAVKKGEDLVNKSSNADDVASGLGIRLKDLVQGRALTAEKLGSKTIRGEFARGAGRGFIGEGGTEAMQTIVEEVSPTLISEKEVDSADLIKKTIDAFAAGGIAGAHFAAPIQGLSVPVARQAMHKYNQDINAAEELAKKMEDADKETENSGLLRFLGEDTDTNTDETIVQPKRTAFRAQDETRGVYDSIENIDEIRTKFNKLNAKKNKSKEEKKELTKLKNTLANRTGADYSLGIKDLVSRSLSPLRGIRNSSPLVNTMVGQLENFFVNGNQMVGRYLRIQDDIEYQIRKKGKLPFQSPLIKKRSKQVADILQFGVKEDVTYDPGVVEVAGRFRREVYEPLFKYLKESGVDINKNANYLTRIYKIRAKGLGGKKDHKKFVDILINEGGRTPAEAAVILDNIISNDNVYVPEGEINIFSPDPSAATATATESSIEKERELKNNEVEALNKAGLLENDVSKITKKYIVSATRRGQLKQFVDTYNPVINELYTTQVMTKEEIQRIKDVVDALQNKYKTIKSPFWRTAFRFINTSTYILTLPLAAITALTEPLIVLHRVSPKNALMGAVDAAVVTLRQSIRSFHPTFTKTENEKGLLSLMQTADLAVQDALRDIGDAAVSRRITDKFFRINLLAQVTQLSRNLAFQAARRQTAEDIKTLAEESITGSVTKKSMQARKRLTIQGLSNVIPGIAKGKDGAADTFKEATPIQKEVMTWASDPDSFYERDKDGNIIYDSDTGKPRLAVPVIITRSLGTVVDEVIMTPNAVNKPLWMSNPILSPVAQLKGFMMVFGNTVGMRFYKDVFQPLYKGRLEAGEIAKYAMMFTLLVASILGTQTLKNGIRYGDDESPWDKLDGWEKIFNALLQSNIFGYGNAIVDTLRADRYGSSPIVSLLGPAAGKLNKLLQAFSTGDPDKIARALSRVTPFLSMFPLTRLQE
jgi:hypothetical protein